MANQRKPHGNEPQSYGSESDWVTGKTGQTLGNTLEAEREDEAFYDESLDAAPESASEAPARSGAEGPHASRGRAEIVGSGGRKIAESNETRQSFFRERDYD